MAALERSEREQLVARLRTDYQRLLREARHAAGNMDNPYRFRRHGMAPAMQDPGILRGFDVARFDRHVQAIRDLEAAFRRLREGVYGRCSDCGEDVGFERLQACPTATRCVACQGRHEETQAHVEAWRMCRQPSEAVKSHVLIRRKSSMQTPLQITFRDLPRSDALETHIREKAKKLEQYFSGMIGCRVVVDQDGRSQQQGKPFNIRIDISVPGTDIIVDKQQNEDVYVALRDAFDAAARRLEEYARQL